MAATIKLDTITNASNATGNNNIELDAYSNVKINGATLSPAASSSNTGNLALTGSLAMGSSFKRNRLINGNFAVDQRNAGTSYAVTTTTSYGSCDRWFWLAGANSVFTAQQVATGNSDFPYALRVQRAASSTSTQYVYYAQIIETINCQDLAGQTVTLSFYANAGSSAAATYPLNYQVACGTGTDQGSLLFNQGNWTGATYPTGAVTITTSRQRFSVQLSVPAGTKEIAVRFYWAGTGTAGANDYVDITGVQLEVGSVATPYERQIYSEQLAQCQRYYETTSYPLTAFDLIAVRVGICATSNAYSSGFNYLVPKRATATVSLYSRNGNAGKVSLIATGADVSGTSTANQPGATGFWGVSLGAVQTTGAGIECGWTASAEL